MFSNLTRRKFIQEVVAGSLTAPLLLQMLGETLKAEDAPYQQQIIWLQGQTSGIHREGIFSSPGFFNYLDKYFKVLPVDQLDLESISINFSEKSTPHILILDGYFTTDYDDPIHNLLKDLIVISRVAILLGNEAAYGSNRPEGFMDLEADLLRLVETPFFRLPGYPVPTRHLLGALNHMILYDLPDLDEYRRPLMFHSTRICDRCEYRGDFEKGRFVSYFGEKEGCLYLLGCKGPVAKNDCATEKWNNTSSWCVSVGSPCTGCSEPDYPAHHGLGMYGQLSLENAGANSFLIRNSGNILKGALAVTVGGIVLHAVSKKTSTPKKNQGVYNTKSEKEWTL